MIAAVDGFATADGKVTGRQERDPANVSRVEWHQAKRGSDDPKALQSMFNRVLSHLGNRCGLEQALRACGYTPAQGAAVDTSRWITVARYFGDRER